MSTMRVGELVDLLAQLPRDYEVTTEGCDCSGDVLSIAVDGDGVWLRRQSKDSGDEGSFGPGDDVGRRTTNGLVAYE